MKKLLLLKEVFLFKLGRIFLSFLFLFLLVFTSCKKEEEHVPHTGNDFESYSLEIQGENVVINKNDGTISVDLPYGYDTDEEEFTATFTLSENAKANIDGEPQISDETENNFSENVIYTVVAEDGSEKEYTVTVTVAEQPTFQALSYYNGENRIGAGDFEKEDLFEISNLQDGEYTYSLKIGEKDAGTAQTVTVTDNIGKIENTLLVDDWKSIGDNENVSITLTIGTDNDEFTYNTIKEQYAIKSWQDLQGMKYDLDGDYSLKNNVALPEPTDGGKFPESLPAAGFEPIGDSNNPFEGSFNGNSKEISNFFIDRSETANVGLFGYVEDGQIEDVNIEVESITGNINVGGLAGYISATEGKTIENCHITGGSVNAGNSSGVSNLGGLVGGVSTQGLATITIFDCSAANAVEGNGRHVGGLVGIFGSGNISNCYATGSVTGTGSVVTEESYGVGGLVGFIFGGNISNSYATGSVTGEYDVGGLVGDLLVGNISNSYATSGSVTAARIAGESNVGGLVGYLTGSISNSYAATGSVTGESNVGVGGLIGKIEQNPTVENSYWDKKSSVETSVGGGTGVSSGEYLEQEENKYIDKEEDGSGTTEVFVGWNFGTDNSNPWKWLSNGNWPVLNWQQ